MFSAAISALDLQIVHVLDWLRIAEDVVVAAPNIATEEITECPSFFLNIQDDLRRAKYVTGIAEGCLHTISDGKRAVIIQAYELAHRLFGICG